MPKEVSRLPVLSEQAFNPLFTKDVRYGNALHDKKKVYILTFKKETLS